MTIDVLFIILGALVAYLLGSIPTAVWYGKAFHGVDVRQHGSGNAGATNTFRVLGKTAGIIVLLIDVLKGFVATEWAWLLMDWKIVQYDHLFLYKLVF
jgi:glycerol-3-phosphate acyltransferase PlsY